MFLPLSHLSEILMLTKLFFMFGYWDDFFQLFIQYLESFFCLTEVPFESSLLWGKTFIFLAYNIWSSNQKPDFLRNCF